MGWKAAFLVAVVVLVVTGLVIGVTPRQKDVVDDEGASGCSCVFGGSNCSGSGTNYWGATVYYGTQCENQDFAHGWIVCPDGTKVTCDTGYKVDADQSGLTCHETGSYAYTRHC